MTANNTDTNGNATFYDTIMIYQSMSGDADSGTSTFTMNGGSLTSKNGHVFHVTNTSAVINLSDVDGSFHDRGWDSSVFRSNDGRQHVASKRITGTFIIDQMTIASAPGFNESILAHPMATAH